MRGAKILKKPNGFWRFRRARAKKKRMCPAWYYLTRMMALAGAQPFLEKFEAREKIARRSPFDRNVKKVLGFLRIRKSARDEILTIFFLKPLGFWCFYVKIVTTTKVLEGFRLARAHVHFVSFFARDSWSLVMLEQEMSFSIVFYRESGRQQNNRIRIPPFCQRLPHENDENMAAA